MKALHLRIGYRPPALWSSPSDIARDQTSGGARAPRRRRPDGIDSLAAFFGVRRRAAGFGHAHGIGSTRRSGYRRARRLRLVPAAGPDRFRCDCRVEHALVGSQRLHRISACGVDAPGIVSFAGPMAAYDFGAPEPSSFTNHHCWALLAGASYEVELPLEGPADFAASGPLWGGNLAMVAHLVGTSHFPTMHGGILVLEDIGEQPYRIERMLYQLHFAGVLGGSAILLGSFNGFGPRRTTTATTGGGDRTRADALRRADLFRLAVRPLPRQADLALRRTRRARSCRRHRQAPAVRLRGCASVGGRALSRPSRPESRTRLLL